MKTVLLVRHADIDLPPAVPDESIELNAAGRARAVELARVAEAAGVTTIFTSTAKRTKQTAAPLAEALHLQPKTMPNSLSEFVANVASAATGSTILVVGHSTTIPNLIAALGVPFDGPGLRGFDDLFGLTITAANQASLIRLKYGAGSSLPAPAAHTHTAPAPLAGPRFTDHAGVVSVGTDVEFRGALFRGKEKWLNAISGGDATEDYLVLVSDEAKDPTVVQILRRSGDGYDAAGMVSLPAGNKEVDVEGIAIDRTNSMVYITGSHCQARKIEMGVIDDVKRKESREQFFRLSLKPDGTAGDVEGPKSLMPAISKQPVLNPFTSMASKENGVDIEGLAVRGERLYFGFRGPVLRQGWVPVMSCTWQDPDHTAEVRYLRLGGRGIRDLTAVVGGFLVLAGPVGDGDTPYRVYFWDGNDQLPAGLDASDPQLLGEFSGLGDGKPEGLVVLKEEGKRYDLLLLCDGLRNGGPTRWSLTRP